MSDNESLGDLEIDAKERTFRWEVSVDMLICSEDGAKRVQHYARKYMKAGNDLNELAEELGDIAGIDPDDVEAFLTVEGKNGAQLSSEMDNGKKLGFFKALNDKINFLEKVKFIRPEE